MGERPDDGPGGERQHGRDEQDQPGRPAALRFGAAASGVDDDRRGQRGHRAERLVDQPAERVRRIGAQRIRMFFRWTAGDDFATKDDTDIACQFSCGHDGLVGSRGCLISRVANCRLRGQLLSQ